MPRNRELVAWGLVIALGWVLIWQYNSASEQEGRAEEAERRAVLASVAADHAKANADKHIAEALAELQHKDADLQKLRASLKAKMPSDWTTTAVPNPKPAATEPLPEAPVLQADEFACRVIKQQIGIWPVAECSGLQLPQSFGVVPVDAALRAEELSAKLAATTVQLAERENELQAKDTALAEAQHAMGEWKKAAKKSRIKRLWAKIEKPLLFAAGVLAGRASK